MKKDTKIISGLLFLSLVPTLAGIVKMVQLITGEGITEENLRFFQNPVGVSLHIVSSLFFGVVGAFQFAPGFRKNHINWHRLSGRFLVLFGLISAVTGLWLTIVFPKLPTDGEWLFVIRLVVGVWMVFCIGQGLVNILKSQIQNHGNWMIRGYAIGMGAGTQVFTHLPWFIFVGGDPTGFPRDMMMGSGWLINFLVAEWIVRKK